ncbi:MAG TPA: phosphatidylglycerophosphatase A [Chromatiales bacterium]|nr:phosphatidylglycerophosphatase A [Thiotrichales bacterium]HIP68511.1 phosphatidylglycerophosphatase A [Chromatiales bacterium]
MKPGVIFSDPVHFLAFGFGSGLAPFAPGTFGTLVAIPLFLLLSKLPAAGYFLVMLALLFFGIWLCGRSAEKLGVHDHGGIVWDEIVGLLITLFMIPAGWVWIVLGFVLFRFFDIVKPWPIRWLDKQVDGGLGIMLDDVLAGIFGWIILQLIIFYTQ